jgi:hypothetical protein
MVILPADAGAGADSVATPSSRAASGAKYRRVIVVAPYLAVIGMGSCDAALQSTGSLSKFGFERLFN